MADEIEFSMNHDGKEYQRKNGEWFTKGKFVLRSRTDAEVPNEVKQKWEEYKKKKLKPITKMQKEIFEGQNKSLGTYKPKSTTTRPTSSTLQSTSKINPLSTAKPIIQNRLKTTEQDFARNGKIEKAIISKNVVTNSQQLTRLLKAQIKAENPSIAKEFLNRMELRTQIMEKTKQEGFKLFEAKKRNDAFSEKRSDNFIEFSNKAAEIVSKLEQKKLYKHSLKRAKVASVANDILVDKMMVTQPKPMKIPRFEIGDLSNFAVQHGVTILNLDKFICATDKRKIIYNEQKQCLFCEVHGKISMNHLNNIDCPFMFCSCPHCYLVGKLGNIRVGSLTGLEKG